MFSHVLTVFRACSVCICGFVAQKQSPKLMTHQLRMVHFSLTMETYLEMGMCSKKTLTAFTGTWTI